MIEIEMLIKDIPVYRENNTQIGKVDVVWNKIENRILKFTRKFKKEYYLTDSDLRNGYILTKKYKQPESNNPQYNILYSPKIKKIWGVYIFYDNGDNNTIVFNKCSENSVKNLNKLYLMLKLQNIL